MRETVREERRTLKSRTTKQETDALSRLPLFYPSCSLLSLHLAKNLHSFSPCSWLVILALFIASLLSPSLSVALSMNLCLHLHPFTAGLPLSLPLSLSLSHPFSLSPSNSLPLCPCLSRSLPLCPCLSPHPSLRVPASLPPLPP